MAPLVIGSVERNDEGQRSKRQYENEPTNFDSDHNTASFLGWRTMLWFDELRVVRLPRSAGPLRSDFLRRTARVEPRAFA